MSFLDQINHAWEVGKDPVKEGVNGILSIARNVEQDKQAKREQIKNEKIEKKQPDVEQEL